MGMLFTREGGMRCQPAPGCIGPSPRIGPFSLTGLCICKVQRFAVQNKKFFSFEANICCVCLFLRKVGQDWPAGHRVQCPLSLEDPLRMFTGNAMQHIICNATYYLQCNVLYV